MPVLVWHGQASFGAVRYDQLSALGVEQARATGLFCDSEKRFAMRFALVRVPGTGPRRRGCSNHGACRANDATLPISTSSLKTSEQSLRDPTQLLPEDWLKALMHRIDAWADGDLVLKGSPTVPEFRNRVRSWVRRELSGRDLAATVMAVTSVGVMVAAMCEAMDLPDSMFPSLVSQVRNASVTGIVTSRGQLVSCSFNGQSQPPPRLLTVI